MRRDGVEKFGPFGRSSRIGHVACNQDRIERVLGVESRELRQHLSQPFVAARSRSPALDAKAIALADDMESDRCTIRHVRLVRAVVKDVHIVGRRHGGVRNRPDERGDRDIAADQHDAVGQRDAGPGAAVSEDREIARQYANGQASQPGARHPQISRPDTSAAAAEAGWMPGVRRAALPRARWRSASRQTE